MVPGDGIWPRKQFPPTHPWKTQNNQLSILKWTSAMLKRRDGVGAFKASPERTKASQHGRTGANQDSPACPVQTLPPLAAPPPPPRWASTAKHSVFIERLCLLSVGGGLPGCPLQLTCPWTARTAPPRTAAAAGCRHSGWTAEAGGCRLPERPAGRREPPGPAAAGWGRERPRRGAAGPSCCRPPPRRRAGRPEVHPPSGPAGLRSDGCRDTESVWTGRPSASPRPQICFVM